MPATLQDIADVVGVSRPTISVVLNNGHSTVRVSEATRRRILDVAKELGYQGNAAARALATSRTGQIGFILSDEVADGLANDYFALHVAGAEQACRDRGYGLNVSLYNLTNLDSFVFPKRVGQRSVDGVILAGHVASGVLEHFKSFDVPCVLIGENTETTGLFPSVSWDMLDGLRQAVDHLAALGHRRIGLGFPSTPWFRRMVTELKATAGEASGLSLIYCELAGATCDFNAAEPLLEAWRGKEPDERPTAFISSGQACAALIKLMRREGLQCPEDLSLVSAGDSRIGEYTNPSLTAIWRDLPQLGYRAATALIDALEAGRSLNPADSDQRLPCRLVQRESCSRPAYQSASKRRRKVGGDADTGCPV